MLRIHVSVNNEQKCEAYIKSLLSFNITRSATPALLINTSLQTGIRKLLRNKCWLFCSPQNTKTK
jgi:hypothetical protein